MLLRYRQLRTTTDFHFGSSLPSNRKARWLAALPSRLTLRGHFHWLIAHDRRVRHDHCRSGRARLVSSFLPPLNDMNSCPTSANAPEPRCTHSPAKLPESV